MSQFSEIGDRFEKLCRDEVREAAQWCQMAVELADARRRSAVWFWIGVACGALAALEVMSWLR